MKEWKKIKIDKLDLSEQQAVNARQLRDAIATVETTIKTSEINIISAQKLIEFHKREKENGEVVLKYLIELFTTLLIEKQYESKYNIHIGDKVRVLKTSQTISVTIIKFVDVYIKRLYMGQGFYGLDKNGNKIACLCSQLEEGEVK